MCGILLHKKNNLHENEFRNNLSRLVHRGPDDNSIYNYNNLFIGHTRLSIIDLSSKGPINFFKIFLSWLIIIVSGIP